MKRAFEMIKKNFFKKLSLKQIKSTFLEGESQQGCNQNYFWAYQFCAGLGSYMASPNTIVKWRHGKGARGFGVES